jgi:hypothetical protein
VTMLHKNLSPSRSYRNKNSRKMSIHFCFRPLVSFRGNHSAQNFLLTDVTRYQYSNMCGKCGTAVLFAVLLRNATIFLHHFIKAILLSFVGCCCGLPLSCLSFKLTCPRFASRTHASEHRTVLTSTQSSPQTTFTHRWMSIGGRFSAIKNPITARCFFRADVVFLHCAIFTAGIQRPQVAKLWNFRQKCGKVQLNERSLVHTATWVCFLEKEIKAWRFSSPSHWYFRMIRGSGPGEEPVKRSKLYESLWSYRNSTNKLIRLISDEVPHYGPHANKPSHPHKVMI